ncbi:tetratricopeptide repeat protein [Archangium sp.]|jgi:tetratricopeptide (TPR) repeat protein|uniref:tetratricopeptide repeat protein n=1 Tax=Archangium sp. TaxID=1872627 RepID=UPI002ED7750E
MRRLRLLAGLLAGLLLGTGCAAGRASPTSAEAPVDAYEARLDEAGLGLRGANRDATLADLEKLAHELETRLQKRPEDARLHALLARTAFYLRNARQALASAERALALAPDLAWPHYVRAFFLGAQGKAEEALADATRAAELEPKQGRHWQLLGTLYLQLDRSAEAQAAIDKALALEPRNAQALFFLGLLYMDQGKTEAALEAYEKARTYEPEFAMAHYNAGQLHQLRGESAQALECFQKAADLDPQDWRTRAKLVQLHQTLGNQEKRDAEREALLLLHQAGKVDKEYFVRDQFQEAGRTVIAVESFTLEGDWAKRYEFQVYAPDAREPALVISLGSYAFTNAFAREKNPSAPRVFHLDAYYPDKTHETYGFFEGEPSYDDTRARVVSILRGEVKPTSSTTPGK